MKNATLSFVTREGKRYDFVFKSHQFTFVNGFWLTHRYQVERAETFNFPDSNYSGKALKYSDQKGQRNEKCV